MRIAVCRPQVPFARGGAEIFTDTLVAELTARGHEADIVSVPFGYFRSRVPKVGMTGGTLAHASAATYVGVSFYGRKR